jgi:hypothetical protein
VSKPGGSVPTLDVTGVPPDAVVAELDGFGDFNAGPYRFVTTAAGAIQLRRNTIAPVRITCVPVRRAT